MKKAKRVSTAICLLAGLLTGGPIFAQAEPPELGAIVKKFIEKAEADASHISDNYTHEELEIVQRLKNGIIDKREEKVFLVEKRGGVIYKKLLSKNNLLARNQAPKPKKESISINSRLFERYIFGFQREDVIEGQKYLVLSFRPKPNFPEEDMQDRVLNNLTGEIWISDSDYTFKKLAARISDEVNYMAPEVFGGRVEKMETSVETGVIEKHFAISKIRVELKYAARFLGWPVNGDSIVTVYYQNYQRRIKQ